MTTPKIYSHGRQNVTSAEIQLFSLQSYVIVFTPVPCFYCEWPQVTEIPRCASVRIKNKMTMTRIQSFMILWLPLAVTMGLMRFKITWFFGPTNSFLWANKYFAENAALPKMDRWCTNVCKCNTWDYSVHYAWQCSIDHIGWECDRPIQAYWFKTWLSDRPSTVNNLNIERWCNTCDGMHDGTFLQYSGYHYSLRYR